MSVRLGLLDTGEVFIDDISLNSGRSSSSLTGPVSQALGLWLWIVAATFVSKLALDP
jgi:hypothetical protein